MQVGNVLGQQMKFVQGVPDMAKINESPELRYDWAKPHIHCTFIVWFVWEWLERQQLSFWINNTRIQYCPISHNIVQCRTRNRTMHGLWLNYDSVLTVMKKIATASDGHGLLLNVSEACTTASRQLGSSRRGTSWNTMKIAFHGTAKRCWWNETCFFH